MKQLNQYKQKVTKKLFYGKYTSKILLLTSAAYMFRGGDFKTIREEILYCKDTDREYYRQLSLNEIEFAELIFGALQGEFLPYGIRAECTHLTFYSNNEQFIDKLARISGGRVREVHKPENDVVKSYLINTTNKIVAKTYDFKFKLQLKYSKDNPTFFKWAEGIPKIKVVNTTAFNGWCYVLDEKTLNMCKLYLGNNIRRIDEFVTEDEM
jgi:hypothetical protein